MKLFCVVSLLLGAFSWTSAQESSDVTLLTDSSHSIQFGFGYFEFRSFDNNSISYKHHLSAHSAIRIGVRIGGDIFSSEVTMQSYRNDTLLATTNRTESPDPRFDVEVNVMYLWYSTIEENLQLYYGTGPIGSFVQRHFLSYERERNWSLGVTGSIGAEWFASRSISLHTEYTSSLVYRRTTSEDWSAASSTNSTFEKRTTDSFLFGPGSVLFGVSIYF